MKMMRDYHMTRKQIEASFLRGVALGSLVVLGAAVVVYWIYKEAGILPAGIFTGLLLFALMIKLRQ